MTKVRKQRKSEGSKTFSSDKRHRSINLDVQGEVTFAVMKSLIKCLNDEFCKAFGPDSYSFRWLDRREGGIQVVRSPHEELAVTGVEEDRCSKQVRFPMFDQEWDDATIIEPMRWEGIVFRSSGCVWRMDEYILFMACMMTTFPGFEGMCSSIHSSEDDDNEACKADSPKKKRKISFDMTLGSIGGRKKKPRKAKDPFTSMIKGVEIRQKWLELQGK